MGIKINFKLFLSCLLMIFIYFNDSYAQSENLEYEALEVEGIQSQNPPQEIIDDALEPDAYEVRKSQKVREARELDESLNSKSDEIVEFKEEILPVEEKPVEEKVLTEEEVIEEPLEEKLKEDDRSRVYDYFFDNSKRSLFETQAQWKNWTLGSGLYQFFPSTFQVDSNSSDKNDDLSMSLGLSFEFGDVGHWSFLPRFDLFLPEKSKDGFLTLYRYVAGIDASYRLQKKLKLLVGTSFLFTTIKGRKPGFFDMGEQGEFFVPSGSRTSINNTLDFALEGEFGDFSLGLRTLLTSFFDSEKRNSIYGLYLNYKFDFVSENQRVDSLTPTMDGDEIIEY